MKTGVIFDLRFCDAMRETKEMFSARILPLVKQLQEDGNRNILAWFGFEEAARNLAQRNGIWMRKRRDRAPSHSLQPLVLAQFLGREK